MPPYLALLLWLILLMALLRYDPARGTRVSSALWVPLVWMLIVASRLPAQWITGSAGITAGGVEDSNALDRGVFLVLILLALGILVSRPFRWAWFFAHNSALVAFLGLALLSVWWSDFPLVALKRWIRDLGNYLVVLVALSDSRPLTAVRTLLRRLCFVLISLSVVLIKYFPEGKGYDNWTGAATYCGVATSKYMLAVICLISGMYFFWDTLTRWPARKERRTRRIISVNILFIVMTLWVQNLANGVTCEICLAVGCLVIFAANTSAVKRHPALLKLSIPIGVCVCLILVFGIGIKADVATAVGRDPTFTDRTLLWSTLLSMKINPALGAGYESFWLGPRLAQIWAAFPFRPNQAHNGYLEIYLNLGIPGLALLIGFLVGTYRAICRQFASEPAFAPLRFALWAVLPICSITTAAYFKGDVLWLTFLLAAVSVPPGSQDKVPYYSGVAAPVRARAAAWPPVFP